MKTEIADRAFAEALAIRAVVALFASMYVTPLSAGERLFPNDGGLINVKNSPYFAKGDGLTDDTAAIQAAIKYALDNEDRYSAMYFIYFPSGTYLVSKTLESRVGTNGPTYGWGSGMLLLGQNDTNTVIKLMDHAFGFGDPAHPNAVIRTGSETPLDPGGSGSCAFHHSIQNLTVDTGVGNPGAVGLDYLVNNRGVVEDVAIRSGDGEGYCGILMNREWPGPGLIKRVRISGFNTGLAIAKWECSMTIEHLTLIGQRQLGIDAYQNVLNIRDLVSSNSVPVLACRNDAQVTLLDGTFTGGTLAKPAITNLGKLYLRNINSSGYGHIVANAPGCGADIPGGETVANLAEYVSRPVVSLFPSPPHALNLPVEETPEYHSNDLSRWTNVVKCGATPNNNSNDDAVGIQKAIDSGAPVVYLPRGHYTISRPIILRGAVRKFVGLHSEIGTNGNFNSLSPTLRFEGGTADTCIVENLLIRGWVEHASSNTLVLRHLDIDKGGYRNTPAGTGKAFLENLMVAPVLVKYPQRLWARQLDSEWLPPALVENHGGNVWILGMKTEGPVTSIKTTLGSTELVGGLHYAATLTSLSGIPLFINDAGKVSYTYLTTQQEWPLQAWETRNGLVRTLVNEPSFHRGVPLYVGYQENNLPGTAQPVITPNGTNFYDPILVSVTCETEGTTLYYATDGSDPSTNSSVCTGTITITNTTTLKVRAFAPGRAQSAVAAAAFTKITPWPAVSPARVASGLAYRYFEGNFGPNLPDFSALGLVRSGTVNNFSTAPRLHETNYAFEFSGYLAVPLDGIYTLYLTSDDGARLYIDGHLVLDNDGNHPPIEISGPVVLQHGKHQIVVAYYQGIGGAVLIVEYAGTGISRQVIPSSVLSQGVFVSALGLSVQESHLEISYTRWLPTAGRTFSFEASEDLINWTPSTILQATVTRSQTTEHVVARDAELVRTADRRFFRLRVD